MREFAGEGQMDIQMIERLAKVIAKEVVDDLRVEIRQEVGEEIRKELRAYFGDMTPTQHAIAHSQLSRVLDKLDKVSGGVLGGIANKVGVGIAVLLVGGAYALWGGK